jgi:hypothetical protein
MEHACFPAYCPVMKNKEPCHASAQLPPPSAHPNETGMAIDRLETEAPTHDRRRDDNENGDAGEKGNKGQTESRRVAGQVNGPPPTKGTPMRKTVGVWIDHRKAVIAVVSDKGEETKVIRSHVEKQPGRFDGVRSTTPYEPQQVSADNSHEREFTGQLNSFYDEVIAFMRDAEAILIFGPGEAKGELKKRIERYKPSDRIVAVETVDKMTDPQIAAKVREYFQKWTSTNRGKPASGNP